MRTLRFAAVLLLLAPFAFGSMTTTALTGRVVIGNAPGAEVTVTATSSALQGSRTTTTNARGRYWLDALPPGTYDVTFSKRGHTSLTRRAVVELARVARADAKLEVSEDEESVTSTASTLTVAETTAITSHITRDALQRMPVESTPAGAASLFARTESGSRFPSDIGEEVIDEVTIIEAGTDRIIARMRRGGEERTFSLRDTISDGISQHLVEATGAGRIVPEKLWFFASAWSGDDAWRHVQDLRGVAGKLTAQFGASHNVEGSYLDANESIAALRYTGIFGLRTNVQAFATNDDWLALRVSHVRGDHVLSAGATSFDDSHALFINDRWSAGHWTINAGVRRENDDQDDRTSPRVAVAYDLHGDGRRAFFASSGDYSGTRMSTIGFATAIGTSGSARIDAIRRDGALITTDELRLAAQYRLFDRFEAGGTYSYADTATRHLATAWVGAEFPIGEHELGVTLLEQLAHHHSTAASTSLAIRYAIPFDRVKLTLASDLTNALNDDQANALRALRFWIRASL
ncbi:MAG TPA: carboxypeptidase-like regulatory domain-containing protein [Thermoanaerobaculia bacterium]